MGKFATYAIQCWAEFYNVVGEMSSPGPSPVRRWIYRGQSRDEKLTTTIERALNGWGISLEEAPFIEFQTIREFRRRLRQTEYQRVQTDTLFCLALMQHHGAPTRLLDCTFSPFVAAAFAMEKGASREAKRWEREHKPPVIWCFNAQWCEEQTKKNTCHDALIVHRNNDERRDDTTFIPLFQLFYPPSAAPLPRRQFVKTENPIHLNERLSTQQGTFLCPADLRSRFVDNLKAMDGWNEDKNILKLCLELDETEGEEFARNLKNMNVSFASLVPGLDGFARSIGQETFHYSDLAKGRAGLG